MLIPTIDLIPYFAEETIETIELKIAQAQSLLESYLVANRSLEVKRYIELAKVSHSGYAQVKMLPIIVDASNYTLAVELRNPGFGWLMLDANEFDIDIDLGEIQLKATTSQGWTNFYMSQPLSQSPFQSRTRNSRQIRISYYSGFDFTAANDANEEFKKNLINLIRLQSSETNAGLKRFKLDEHYEVEYQNARDSMSTVDRQGFGTQLNDLLAYFKQFKPRYFNG